MVPMVVLIHFILNLFCGHFSIEIELFESSNALIWCLSHDIAQVILLAARASKLHEAVVRVCLGVFRLKW